MQENATRMPSDRFRTLTVLISFAGLTCGANAIAATPKSDCVGLVSAQSRSESPVEALSVSPVDHVPVESAAGRMEEIEPDTENSDTAAPFLYLTPRVASVLRDIFDAAREIGEDADETVSSPVADTDKTHDKAEVNQEILPVLDADSDVDLPFLQRQMFRTDI